MKKKKAKRRWVLGEGYPGIDPELCESVWLFSDEEGIDPIVFGVEVAIKVNKINPMCRLVLEEI